MKKIVCAPEDYNMAAGFNGDLDIVLYGHSKQMGRGEVGATMLHRIQQKNLEPALRAWDLVSIALSVVATDLGVRRDDSPDGWTRQLDLRVAVTDPDFWSTQYDILTQQLQFLSTDMWSLSFLGGGLTLVPASLAVKPEQDCVVLLSGGLDSLIGTIDLVTDAGKDPYAVSQVSLGDKRKQSLLASIVGSGLPHLQLNHNARYPGPGERSQRARSFVFLAYGVLAATTLKRYHEGEEVTLYVCENGFISINPPLTNSRLGSLSTRTTHPVFLQLFQEMINNAGLRVTLKNPYQFSTKGEMLKGCADQVLLRNYGHITTSCGRYARNGYTHCGRCLPCLIRRSAFHASGVEDKTRYVYIDLSRDDENHARYDDVRSAAIAVTAAKEVGLTHWAGPALSSAHLHNINSYKAVVGRGLDELQDFLRAVGVI